MIDDDFRKHWVKLDDVLNNKSKKLKLKKLKVMNVNILPEPFKTLDEQDYPVFFSEAP